MFFFKTGAIEWIFYRHRRYWCPGALAPGHQYPQCWVCIPAFPDVSGLNHIGLTHKSGWGISALNLDCSPSAFLWSVICIFSCGQFLFRVLVMLINIIVQVTIHTEILTFCVMLVGLYISHAYWHGSLVMTHAMYVWMLLAGADIDMLVTKLESHNMPMLQVARSELGGL